MRGDGASEAELNIGLGVEHSSDVDWMGCVEASTAELLGSSVGDVPGQLVSSHGNVVSRDPYQNSELMRKKRHLRLERAIARAEEERFGMHSNKAHEGPRTSRPVIRLGLKAQGQEVQKQAAVSSQVVPKKALKSAQKGTSGPFKKKVSFGPLV